MRSKTSAALALMLAILLAVPALLSQVAEAQQDGFPLIELPEGFEIEQVASGLTYPVAVD